MSSTAPSTDRGRATRTRIVRAAAEVIADRGASRLSLDQVMTRSGASKGQVYHYFEHREELLHAAVRATIDEVTELQGELMQHLDSWDHIQHWFDCLVEMQEDRDSKGGCPLASLTAHLVETDEHVRQELVDGFERWEGLLATGLVTMRERGELASDADPCKLATATMALVQGGMLLTQVRRDPRQLRIALDAAWSHLRASAADA